MPKWSAVHAQVASPATSHWSIAKKFLTLTDFFQALVLIAAICVLLPIVLGAAGGVSAVLDSLPEGRTRFLPTGGLLEWLFFVQAWLLIGLGNLPGQDLMQRALSSKSERVAQWSAYFGGSLYLVVGAAFEERGLLRLYGADYADYRRRVPAFIPWKGRALR